MSPRLRRFALTAHIAFSVGWNGAVAAFLALAIVGLIGHDAQVVRAAYLAMELIARWVIVPLALAALLSGLVMGIGTRWGLFRHYWVLFTLLLTILAVAVLLGQLELVSYVAGVAAETRLSTVELREARTSLVAHAGGGLLVLLAITGLNVYKPPGLTPYGKRRLRKRRGEPPPP